VVSTSAERWKNTTHDWAGTVDSEHLAQVRREPHVFAALSAGGNGAIDG
jgi:topoisomerase-4 subunit B